MYPVAINNLVKLACASYLISMSKADTLTFVYKDYRISFSLNYGKKQRRRNIEIYIYEVWRISASFMIFKDNPISF